MTRRVAGYEYCYSFSIGEEPVSRYNVILVPRGKPLVFEIRTNFIMKTMDGRDSVIDSEEFNGVVYDDGNDRLTLVEINCRVSYRLEEYWMTEEETARFEQEALDFIRSQSRTSTDVGVAVPIVVNVEVRTVQRNDEPVGAALERAIRADKLVPVYVWPCSYSTERDRFSGDTLCNVMDLERDRVCDVSEGLAVMRICGICLLGPTIGAQITALPPCMHAFHSDCVAKWLLEEDNMVCPSCNSDILI